MTIYLILLLILGIASWLSIFKPTGFSNSKNLNQVNVKELSNNKANIITAIVILLVIISSCRGLMVGYDTINYYGYFEFKKMYPGNIAYEPLYEMINFIVVKLNLPFNFVLLICAIITFVSFGIFVYKFADNPVIVFFFFVALGFFGNTFNAVRQYLALAVFLFAIKYIRDGGFIKYVLLIAIAYLFHSSAIILLPLYFIRYFKLTPVFIIVTTILLLAGSMFMAPAVKLISNFTNFSYFDRYFASGNFTESISIYYVLYSAGMMCVFLLFFFLRGKVMQKTEDMRNYDLFLMMFFISVAIRVFGTFSGMFSVINRLNVYFFFSICFLLPYLFDCVKSGAKKICLFTTFVLGVAYNLISGVLRGTNGVYPYNFIWGEEIVPSVIFACAAVLIVVAIIYNSLKVIDNKMLSRRK